MPGRDFSLAQDESSKVEVEELVELLSRQGRHHSQGVFSLDWEAGRRKYGRWLAATPHSFLGRLLRLALEVQAQSVRLHQRGRQVLMEIDRPLVAPERLTCLLRDDSGPVELAQALMMLLALKPVTVELVVAQEGRARRWVYREAGLESEDISGRLSEGTFLRMVWKDRHRPELQWVRENFTYSPLELSIGGQSVHRDLSAPRHPPLGFAGPLGEVVGYRDPQGRSQLFYRHHQILQWPLGDFEGDHGLKLIHPSRAQLVLGGDPQQGRLPCCGLIFIECGSSLEPAVQLVYQGETIESYAEPGLPIGWGAVLDATHLNLEWSGDRVIKDEAFGALESWLFGQVNLLLERLRQRYPAVKDRDYRASLLFDPHLRGVLDLTAL